MALESRFIEHCAGGGVEDPQEVLKVVESVCQELSTMTYMHL